MLIAWSVFFIHLPKILVFLSVFFSFNCCSTFLVGGKVELLLGDWDNLWAEWRLVVEVGRRDEKKVASHTTHKSWPPFGFISCSCLLAPSFLRVPTTIKYHASSSFAAASQRETGDWRERESGNNKAATGWRITTTTYGITLRRSRMMTNTHNKVRENHWLCFFNCCYLL